MATIIRYPQGYQFLDANGDPLAAGQLHYYQAGTSTRQDTYSDADGTVPNSNPIILNAAGRLTVDVYLGDSADYKEVLLTSDEATVDPWPDDDIPKADPMTDVFTGDSGSGGTIGLVPAPAAGDAAAGKFLKADATWAVPPGGLTTSGSPAAYQVAVFSAADTITGIAVGTASQVLVGGGAGANPAFGSVPAAALPNPSSSTLGGVTSLAAVANKFLTSIGTDGIPVAAQPAASDVSGLGALAVEDSLASTDLTDGTTAGTNMFTAADVAAQTALLNAVVGDSGSGGTKGMVPAPGAGEASYLLRGDGAWATVPTAVASQNLDSVARLGIGTTDSGNDLSVSGSSALFSNGSSGFQVKLSKNAAGDTASYLFQTNFSGRAEFGLIGDDDFTMKVSPDGSSWNNAIVIDKTAASVTFPNTGGFTGDSGSGGSVGLVPAPGAGDAAAGKYLDADGTWTVPPSGGTPGGSDTQVQFNNSSSFGGSANLTWSSPNLTIGVQQTAQGGLVLANTAAGAYATTLKSSNSASAAWTMTLPVTAGSANYALTTDGSGNTSWAQISLSAGVTGTLPIANGGTGQTTAAAALNALAPVLTYASTGNNITAQTANVGDTALCIKGMASQTGDLQKWQDSSGNDLVAIEADGKTTLSNAAGTGVLQLLANGASGALTKITYASVGSIGRRLSIGYDNSGSVTDQLSIWDSSKAGINLSGTAPAVEWEVNGAIRLWSNSLLATPISGTHEYDGKAPYFSPTYGVRGIIKAYQYAKVSAATQSLTDGTSAQSFLPSSTDAFPIQGGYYYKFRARIRLDLNTTNARTVSFLLTLSTGSFSWVNYRATSLEGSSYPLSGTAVTTVVDVGTATALTASTNNQYVFIDVEGEFKATSAANLTPQIQFSAAPGGTDTSLQGSYFELACLGPNAYTTGVT